MEGVPQRALVPLTPLNPQSPAVGTLPSGPEGWCCEDLGREVPLFPLPHVNSTTPLTSVSPSLQPWGVPAPPFARSVDSLFEELIIFGFVKKSEPVALKDYIGETPPRHLPPG